MNVRILVVGIVFPIEAVAVRIPGLLFTRLRNGYLHRPLETWRRGDSNRAFGQIEEDFGLVGTFLECVLRAAHVRGFFNAA